MTLVTRIPSAVLAVAVLFLSAGAVFGDGPAVPDPIAEVLMTNPVDENTSNQPIYDIVFSELAHIQEPGQTEWLELANVSDRAIDMKNWRITDGTNFDFSISDRTLVLAPGGFLVVLFDGTGAEPEVKGKQLTVHTPAGLSGNVLEDINGQIALFGISTQSYGLRCYVCWGKYWGMAPDEVLYEARQARKWAGLRDSVDGTVLGWRATPGRQIERGGSIGLVVHDPAKFTAEQWGIFTPDEVNPGESGFSRRIPTTWYPSGYRKDGQSFLEVVPLEEGVRYQFQVSRDSAFTRIVDAATQTASTRKLIKIIPPGQTFYWRVRAIYPDGKASRWSPVWSLTRNVPDESTVQRPRFRTPSPASLPRPDETLTAGVLRNPPEPMPEELILTEICYLPKPGENEWVEIANVSGHAVDMERWRLMDGMRINLALSGKPLFLPAGGTLVVVFDGTGAVPEINGSRITVHSPPNLAGNVLGDKGGHLALGGNRSYIAWGLCPGKFVYQAAINLKLFGVFHPSGGPFYRGGSVGLVTMDMQRYVSERWGIYQPDEVSPGESGESRRAPRTKFPFGNSTDYRTGIATLSVLSFEEGVRFQYQLSKDREFTSIVEDVKDRWDHRTTQPVPIGQTYYWRVRAIYPDGVKSKWSAVRPLRNG